MYILFNNDIPDPPSLLQDPAPYCHECGGHSAILMDSTYSYAHSDPVALSSQLSKQYEQISQYMVANRLVINDEKTHLVVLGTKSMTVKRDSVSLQAGVHTITPTKNEKLLGCEVSQDLKWRHHLMDSEQSTIRQLTSRINGLCMISSRADFNTKLMVANGIVMSKVCYLIQLWGGCEGYLLHSLQVLVNRAARSVTGLSCFTSTRRLLDSCNWLSVKQLVVYQTLIMIHKTLQSGTPSYLFNRLSTPHSYKTRQGTSGSIRQDETFKSVSSLPRNSFRYRGAQDYNRLPASFRTIFNITTFKVKVKQWVKRNISLE